MGVLTEQNLKRKINKEGIVVYPYNEENVTGLGIDLSIGILKPLTETHRFKESETHYEIPPYCYFIVITKEHIWISAKYVGTLHSRGTLAAKGIYTNATNVDPNFSGQMIMSLVNVSNKKTIIQKDQTYITLILHETATASKISRDVIHTRKSIRVVEELIKDIYNDPGKDTDQKENLNQILLYLNSNDSKKDESSFRTLIDKADRKIFSEYFTRWLGNNWLSQTIIGIFYSKWIDSITLIFLLGSIAFVLVYLYKISVGKIVEIDYKLLGSLLLAILGLIALYRKKNETK